MPILEITGLRKTYTTRLGGNRVEALKNVSFTAEPGEYIAIMGESGSGKTTLLNILAALDKPTGGSVILDGMDLAKIKESKLADFRRDNLGFVFQEFNLLDTFTVRDNILLPLVLRGEKYPAMQPKLNSTAELLGISALLDKYPYEISGGQKQRTAAARAMITEPKLLLAEINRRGQTILMVTHSAKAASRAKRVLFIKDGAVFHQLYRGNCSDDEFYRRITDALTLLSSSEEPQSLRIKREGAE